MTHVSCSVACICSINDSIIKYLSLWNLEATVLERPASLSQKIAQFIDINTELQGSELTRLDDHLWIIQFTLSPSIKNI